MAKQIAGLCFFEATIDDITFYKMDGQYYARAKSSLSSKRVKTSPEFKWTMVNARLLARASKIGSQVYKALPPGWRQFWMYRSFTGEAFTLLKEDLYNDAEVKHILWKCYIEYWEQRKVVDPDNPIWQPKPQKIRKRRKYSEESIQRLLKRKDKYGRRRWRDPEEEERKRLAKERNAAAFARLLEKEKRLAQQNIERADQQALHAIEAPQNDPTTVTIIHAGIVPDEYSYKRVPNPEALSPWYVTPNGALQTIETHPIFPEAQQLYNSS
jgi:hypothetical protein